MSINDSGGLGYRKRFSMREYIKAKREAQAKKRRERQREMRMQQVERTRAAFQATVGSIFAIKAENDAQQIYNVIQQAAQTRMGQLGSGGGKLF